MPQDQATGVHYEVFGQGEPLFLGFPLMASQQDIFGQAGEAILRGYLDQLSDRYRILLVDYPSIGKSANIPPDQLTADRAVHDLLAVADAAGFDRFAWFGYAWGAALGLLLASRTERLSALAIGGWSPLDGPAAEMLQGAMVNVDDPPASAMVVLRNPQQYRQWVTFWTSMRGWPDAASVGRIDCPRMVFVGEQADASAGGVSIPYVARLKARRADLEGLGWRVDILAGRDHAVGLQPEIVAPLLRDFLDGALPIAG